MQTIQPSEPNRPFAVPAQSRRAKLLAAAIAGLALLDAGCGASSPNNPNARSRASFTAAAFKYSSCMRDHGLSSFPDPTMTDHDGQQVAYLTATIPEFISILRNHDLPKMNGRAGAFYCIWWGEVNDDSDGPLEMCRPVPADQAQRLAIQVPELVLRTEPAHREAFIHLGRSGQIQPAQYQLITQSLLDWVQEHTAQPIDLGARMTYLADATVPELETEGPDCDFALPIN
ncbi:MAG: hypothetical protein ACLP0J_16340 [Solirubrobacteraceae bacterium]